MSNWLFLWPVIGLAIHLCVDFENKGPKPPDHEIMMIVMCFPAAILGPLLAIVLLLEPKS